MLRHVLASWSQLASIERIYGESQYTQGWTTLTNIQMKSIDQDQFGQKDRRSLVVDGLPTVMVQVADL